MHLPSFARHTHTAWQVLVSTSSDLSIAKAYSSVEGLPGAECCSRLSALAMLPARG